MKIIQLLSSILVACIACSCSDPSPDPKDIEPVKSVLSGPIVNSVQEMDGELLKVAPHSGAACVRNEAVSAAVAWDASATGASGVKIYVSDSAGTSGKLWIEAEASGRKSTPRWARKGTVFELRDTASERLLASATLECS
jgi:hypothetical protein